MGATPAIKASPCASNVKRTNRASKKGRIRLTIDDVIKAAEVQRTDPERYARSPRLKQALALF